MVGQAKIPVNLGRLRSLHYLLGIATNPLVTTRRLHQTYGSFAILQYPHSRRSRSQILPCISDVELYERIASAPDTWRPVNVAHRGLRHHASNRLAAGMTRMRGARVAHYRRLITPLLSRRSVRDMSSRMAEIAETHVSSWPTGVATDLRLLIERLTQDLAVALLFGDDRADALPIADMISRQWAAGWMPPSRDFIAWMRVAGKQERAILAWAAKKRGDLDPKNLLSIIVNNPDERGRRPSRQIIGGFLSFVFGAAYETSQNALAWTLILLTQHPRIAGEVADEISGALHGDPPTLERIDALPLLSAVAKEGMRLFPPVPIQFRRSLIETSLGEVAIKAGVRILTSVHLINRNPDLYGEPDRFRPERWEGLNPSPYEYPVFGAGARMCPGFLMGDQIVKVGLAAILSRYRVEMTPDARIDYRAKITLTPYPGVPVILRDLTSTPVAHRVTGRIHELVDLAVAT
jgi:cytochrome P450